MSVVAMEAMVLHDVLGDDGASDIAERFFDQVVPVVDAPWFFATALDSLFPVTSGPEPDGAGSYREYMAYVVPVAHDDGRVAEAVSRVVQLEQPPSSLLRAAIVNHVFGDVEEDAQSAEPPSWVPSSIGDVWPLIDENLDAPSQVRYWPGVQAEAGVPAESDD